MAFPFSSVNLRTQQNAAVRHPFSLKLSACQLCRTVRCRTYRKRMTGEGRSRFQWFCAPNGLRRLLTTSNKTARTNGTNNPSDPLRATTAGFPIAFWLAPTPQSVRPWRQPYIRVWLCSIAYGISPSPSCTLSVPSPWPLCSRPLLIDRLLPWTTWFAGRASVWSNRLWRSAAFLRQRFGLYPMFHRRQKVRRPIEKVWRVSSWLRPSIKHILGEKRGEGGSGLHNRIKRRSRWLEEIHAD